MKLGFALRDDLSAATDAVGDLFYQYAAFPTLGTGDHAAIRHGITEQTGWRARNDIDSGPERLQGRSFQEHSFGLLNTFVIDTLITTGQISLELASGSPYVSSNYVELIECDANGAYVATIQQIVYLDTQTQAQWSYYDAQGTLHNTKQDWEDNQQPLIFDAPSSGVIGIRLGRVADLAGQSSLQYVSFEVPNRAAANPPTISSDAAFFVGDTLTLDTSPITDDDGVSGATYVIEWQSGGQPVGTDSTTYTLQQSDVGNTIVGNVSFTDDLGNAESISSAPTIPITGPAVLSVSVDNSTVQAGDTVVFTLTDAPSASGRVVTDSDGNVIAIDSEDATTVTVTWTELVSRTDSTLLYNDADTITVTDGAQSDTVSITTSPSTGYDSLSIEDFSGEPLSIFTNDAGVEVGDRFYGHWTTNTGVMAANGTAAGFTDGSVYEYWINDATDQLWSLTPATSTFSVTSVAPSFPDPTNEAVSVPENTAAVGNTINSAVGSPTPQYRLDVAQDQADFDIDINTGALTFKNPPDYEVPGQRAYSPVITAFNTEEPPATRTIDITVTNVVETSVKVTCRRSDGFYIPNGQTVRVAIYSNFAALDSNAEPIYSEVSQLISGNFGEMEIISPLLGDIGDKILVVATYQTEYAIYESTVIDVV